MIKHRIAGPDDPIYKEGLKVFTPRSARGSTKSTKSSQSKPATRSGGGSRRLPKKGK